MSAALVISISWKPFYELHYYAISGVIGSTLVLASFLSTLSQLFPDFLWSPALAYSHFIIVTLLLYTVLPLNFHTTVLLSCGYSIIFETLLSIAKPERVYNLNHVIVNVLLHLCLHAIGIHIKITIEGSIHKPRG